MEGGPRSSLAPMYALMALAVFLSFAGLWSTLWYGGRGREAMDNFYQRSKAVVQTDPAAAMAERVEGERLSREWRRRGAIVSGTLSTLSFGGMFGGAFLGARANKRNSPRTVLLLGIGIGAVFTLTVVYRFCEIMGVVGSDRLRDAAGARSLTIGAGYGGDAEYLSLLSRAADLRDWWSTAEVGIVACVLVVAGALLCLLIAQARNQAPGRAQT